MSIIAWIVLGLLAGALARLLIHGDQPGGCITTTILGMVGAVVGGFIASALGFGSVTGVDLTPVPIAAVGALIVLLIWGASSLAGGSSLRATP